MVCGLRDRRLSNLVWNSSQTRGLQKHRRALARRVTLHSASMSSLHFPASLAAGNCTRLVPDNRTVSRSRVSVTRQHNEVRLLRGSPLPFWRREVTDSKTEEGRWLNQRCGRSGAENFPDCDGHYGQTLWCSTTETRGSFATVAKSALTPLVEGLEDDLVQ